jgi:hypothetical protein
VELLLYCSIVFDNDRLQWELKLCVLEKKGPRKVNQLTNILKHLVDNRAFYDQITTRLVL